MAIDLVLLGFILIIGLLGAAAGAASQVAQIVGAVGAFLVARPLGRVLGPKVAASFQWTQLIGTLVATIIVFLVVWLAVRYIVTTVLRRVMAGKDPHDRSLDRTLGLVFGAAKGVAFVYLLVSALVFVEENVRIGGRGIGLPTKDSWAFHFGRKYNLFERTQYAPVGDLMRVTREMETPEGMERLRQNPAFRALEKDPRLQRALEDPEVQRAVERGDYRSLLQSNAVLQLVQDPDFVAKLQAATRSSTK